MAQVEVDVQELTAVKKRVGFDFNKNEIKVFEVEDGVKLRPIVKKPKRTFADSIRRRTLRDRIKRLNVKCISANINNEQFRPLFKIYKCEIMN